MLLENLKTSATLKVPCGWVSWTVYLPTIILPIWQSKTSVGVTTPASRAAAMLKVFMVEPGSNTSVIARLRAPLSPEPPGSFGLYDGTEAMVRTSPVRGSRSTAITALAWWRSWASAMARSVMKVR